MRTWLKLSKVGWLAVLGLVLVMVTASGASALTITIANPSFEDQQPPTGWSVNPIDGYYTNPTFPVTGWTYGNSAVAGMLHPETTTWMYYVPDGLNVARIGNGSYMSQILTATILAANTQYTLTVAVGARRDAYAFGGYQVQLGVDNGGTFVILQQDNNTQTPTAGNFITSTVNFDSSGSLYVGKNLEVRLYVPNSVQTLFDDVRLDYVPLPSTMLLLGSGLVGLALLRRRWNLKK